MTNYYLRQGVCNRCGQCCGATYTFGGAAPIGINPFPKTYPWDLAAWSAEALDQHFPLRQLIEAIATGYGEVKITGKRYYYIFVEGAGICTDLEPYGDPAAYANRCPLLVLNGEAANPPTACAGVSMPIFTNLCGEQPRQRMTEAELAQWQAAYPACSYTWNLEQ